MVSHRSEYLTPSEGSQQIHIHQHDESIYDDCGLLEEEERNEQIDDSSIGVEEADANTGQLGSPSSIERRPSSYAAPIEQNTHFNGPQRNRLTFPLTVRPSAWPQPYSPVQKARVRGIKFPLPVFRYEYQVPSPIQNSVEPKYKNVNSSEFTYLRYTAATCDPNDFTLKNGYNLRPAMAGRSTELLIAVTYYNEDKYLFCRTLSSVMRSIQSIINLPSSEIWNNGSPAWQKIVFCLIFDGLDPCSEDVLDVLATIGLFQYGIMKKDINGNETVAHIFEFTTQLSVTENTHQPELIRPHGEIPYPVPPVQMMLCLKQRSSTKINSHRWLFNAFGRILNPEIVVTVDTGTKLSPKAALRLWEAFYNDKNLGGACGNVQPILGWGFGRMLNPLLAAQNFEYKINCILEKPMESSTGFVTVLPDAFSGYRFRAIMGLPLERYFRSDHHLAGDVSAISIFGEEWPFRRNMYLAEDRILSFELVFKRGSKWHSSIIKSAKAETAVPEGVVDFITKRRSCLNGTFAATAYSIMNFSRIYRTSHNTFRKLFLHFQLVYTIVSFVLSWFNLAAFLLTMFIINEITGSPPTDSKVRPFPFGATTASVNATIQCVYVGAIVLQLVLALGNRPRDQIWGYIASFLIFGVIQIYFLVNLGYVAYRVVQIVAYKKIMNGGGNFNYIHTFYSSIGSQPILIACASIFGSYFISSLLRFDPWHMFFSFPQYLVMASTYTNMLHIYAFSNCHDLSCGDKDDKDFDAVNQLPSVKVDREQKFTFEEPKWPPSDPDVDFEATVKRALAPYKQAKHKHKSSAGDCSKGFGANLLAVNIFSNFFLIIIILNDTFGNLKFLGDTYQHKVWFFRIWLWGVSGRFIFRFVGSCIDLILTGFTWPFYKR